MASVIARRLTDHQLERVVYGLAGDWFTTRAWISFAGEFVRRGGVV